MKDQVKANEETVVELVSKVGEDEVEVEFEGVQLET